MLSQDLDKYILEKAPEGTQLQVIKMCRNRWMGHPTPQTPAKSASRQGDWGMS